MKKYILCILLLFLLTGCTKNDSIQKNIHTVIEEDKNIVVGINYPITGFKTLDTLIKEEVEVIYNNFKDEYENFNSIAEKSELNVDYTYDIINDQYINICIHIFINSSKLAHPINELKTYVFDTKQKKLLTLKDIIKEDDMKKFAAIVTNHLIENYSKCIFLDEVKNKITSSYQDYPLFTFDDTNLSVFFNPATIAASYCDIVEVEIPLEKIALKINITKEASSVIKHNIELPKNVIDPNKKVVALTFDDGPSRYTKDIIEYLHKEDAVGTFFILGNKVEIYTDTLNTSLRYGNEIGNHSYNHKWLTKLGPEELLMQIDKTQNIIHENTGYTPKIFRPTYGSINQMIRKNISLDIILWSVDTMDWKYKSIDKITERATKKVKDGDIILMHDTHERTYKALLKIVPELKKQGFTFVTISELKEIELLRKQMKQN